MNYGWQDILVLAICLAAAAYVARVTWKSIAGRAAGCGSRCGKCSPNTRKTVLSIESASTEVADSHQHRL